MVALVISRACSRSVVVRDRTSCDIGVRYGLRHISDTRIEKLWRREHLAQAAFQLLHLPLGSEVNAKLTFPTPSLYTLL